MMVLFQCSPASCTYPPPHLVRDHVEVLVGVAPETLHQRLGPVGPLVQRPQVVRNRASHRGVELGLLGLGGVVIEVARVGDILVPASGKTEAGSGKWEVWSGCSAVPLSRVPALATSSYLTAAVAARSGMGSDRNAESRLESGRKVLAYLQTLPTCMLHKEKYSIPTHALIPMPPGLPFPDQPGISST